MAYGTKWSLESVVTMLSVSGFLVCESCICFCILLMINLNQDSISIDLSEIKLLHSKLEKSVIGE